MNYYFNEFLQKMMRSRFVSISFHVHTNDKQQCNWIALCENRFGGRNASEQTHT